MQTEVISSSSLPSRYQDLSENLFMIDTKLKSPEKYVLL